MSERKAEYGVDRTEEPLRPRWSDVETRVLAWVERAEDLLDDLEPAFDLLRAREGNRALSGSSLLAALLLTYEPGEEP